jgi:NADPH-dependent 2,4-dienoyl-CoA reductase/sulfur reductase-like enzyme
MHHVIIGPGPAGVIAAETLRKTDPDSQITLIGDEPEPPYSRMALPYYLTNQISERGTYLRKDDGHFANRRIDVVQDQVTEVNPSVKHLRLAKGGERSYDKLLVATGSRPAVPPVPGMDLPGVYPCWTMEHCRQIAQRATPGAKVVLIGAGFIGSIILQALAERGVDLTVVEMGNRMVPRMMNDTAGGLIKHWCESKGVKVHTSKTVDGIHAVGGSQSLGATVKQWIGGDSSGAASGSHPLSVHLSGGEVLPADLVIPATGVRANIEFLQSAQLKTDAGIIVDHHLQSSHSDIYAAGDVAQGKDFSTGEYSVQAVQPTAADHGRIAAMNMAGRETKHPGSVNMNVLDTMGLIASSFGLWMGSDGGESAELCNNARYQYLNLQFEEDVLVGASSLGLTEHVGVVRGLIQTKTKLGKWKDRLKADPTRLMEAYIGSTQAVGHNAQVAL